MRRNLLGLALLCALLQPCFAQEQTFELGSQPAQKQNSQPTKKGRKQTQASPDAQSSTGLGWGSSIEVGRNSRAAEDALKKGNYSAAMAFAQRVTQAAPNDPRNWFLLGYTSRLAGNYTKSLDAFDSGLAHAPNSVEGLSGKAQTYIRMGETDEAKKLLLQVIAANPRRGKDLAMAGELFMQSGDLRRATNLLERSENVEPSSHAELLLAIAYMKQKQTDKAKALLDKAMQRDPRNVDVFRAVAQYYREAHDYKSAVAILNKSPRKTVDIYSELGYTYSLGGMKRESANAYEQAASMAPKAVNVQLAAAQSQLRAGNLDKARMYLARGEQLDANYYRLHAIRGDLAVVEHRDLDATKEYLAAIAAMPEGPAEGILYPTQLRLQLVDAFRSLQDEAAVQQQVRLGLDALAKFHVDATQQVEYLRLRAALRGIGNDFTGAEADLKQALQIEPGNDSVTLQYANLLWRNNRKNEARQMYSSLLQRDQKNRFALEALGYLSRDVGDNKAAEGYFTRMAAAYPDDYVPFVALGDLYTATREFAKAEASYQKAFKLAPSNPQIIAAGSNAAIDAHKVDLAGEWIARATGTMKNDPRVMRETERFLFLKGRYLESARIGQQAVAKMPRDRDAAVYLAYDYYNLGRFDDTLSLVSRYESILPKEPNFPLLAGHVHRQNQLLQQAIDDFTRVIQKDPRMLDALVIRGYVRNDMQDAGNAVNDFNPALKVNPDNGVARLGRALSYLQLHRSREALDDIANAQKTLGDVGAIHMARATAYRQMRVLDKAEKEYRLALKASPDDLKLHLALADTLYHGRHYGRAIDEWNDALRLSPDDPVIYASLAAANAQIHNRPEAYRYIQLAEHDGADQAAILVATGEALLTLGDQKAASIRFTQALDAPDANRVDVRLEFAKLFHDQGKDEAAKQEVALAFAEARIGEASPVTTDNMVEAANIFLSAHDFDLAERYFNKAKEMGASDDTVAIGMANTYIAQGRDRDAEALLKQLGSSPDYEQNYDYQLAWANIYNQRHDTLHAITAFAHANQLSANDPVAERGLLQVAGDEGTEIYPNLFMQSNLTSGALYDDSTIYQMDNQLTGTTTLPRSSQETDLISTFRYHTSHFTPINGSFGVRNYHGQLSVPSDLQIVGRNTYDTLFDVGTTPVVRLGNAHFILNPGIAFTIRRDTESPVPINQNLFRQYLYLNSSSLFQWLTIHANGIHESGPFTEQNLSSRDLGATVEFEVGRPWGHNSLVTGYSVRDLLFHPLVREFFTTATWVGWTHTFGNNKASVTGLGKFIRSWRVQDQAFATGQALVPGGRFNYKFNERWQLNAAFDLQHGQGFHLYDNVQSGFLISYVKPLHRGYDDGTGNLSVEYPLRFSAGLQQQSFYNFTGANAKTSSFRPVIQISLF